jgi:hypothetical protein
MNWSTIGGNVQGSLVARSEAAATITSSAGMDDMVAS